MLSLCNKLYSQNLIFAVNSQDEDKLYCAAMNFIDEFSQLKPEARVCWLYLFTDNLRNRDFDLAALAVKVGCTIEETIRHLSSLEAAGLIRFACPLETVQ